MCDLEDKHELRHSDPAPRKGGVYPAKDATVNPSLPAGRPLDQPALKVYPMIMPKQPVVSVRMSPAWLEEARQVLMLGEDALASDIVRTAIRKCIGDDTMEPDTKPVTPESAA